MAIYNPKSLKAEEFIHDQEILDTIAYAEANKRNVELIDAILDKARPRKSGNGVTCAGLDHREASRRCTSSPTKSSWRSTATAS